MRLYLASFLQPENFGPGVIYGISHGDKPRNIDVRLQFKPFIPDLKIINHYYELLPVNADDATTYFVRNYTRQLEKICKEIKLEAIKQNCIPSSVLPFKDGDTLCSWERSKYKNYRSLLSPFLSSLGYQVTLN